MNNFKCVECGRSPAPGERGLWVSPTSHQLFCDACFDRLADKMFEEGRLGVCGSLQGESSVAVLRNGKIFVGDHEFVIIGGKGVITVAPKE